MKKTIMLISIILLTGCSSKLLSVNNDTEKYCNVSINNENRYIIEIIKKEKYFICNNLQKYINYLSLNNLHVKDVISIVNSESYRNYYTNIKETDYSKDILILINKYNYLNKDYIPSDLEQISQVYNKGTNSMMRHIAKIHFEEMCENAKKEGIIIYNMSAYRDYNKQEKIYNGYLLNYGYDVVDKFSARPGHSEHQSGLATDINTINKTFINTKEYKWLQNNAYKYGFIERYPKDSEKITGYEYEPWHYRYVGMEIAKSIKEEGITFDEYYAYYLNN